MKQYSLVKTLPVFMAFYVMGFGDIVGVATGYAQRDFGLSSTLTQVLTMMAFVCHFSGSIYYSYRKGLRYSQKLKIK